MRLTKTGAISFSGDGKTLRFERVQAATFDEELFKGFHRQRATEEIPLHLIAAQEAQETQLLFSLYPFGVDLELQAVRELDNSHYDGRVLRVFGHVADK